MKLDFVTLDVFTRHRFGGNPLAVVFDPQAALDTATMQTIAREFNLSETSFVRPAREAGADAEVRIFTPATEMPWAGHPNVGTAWALTQRPGVRPSVPGIWRFDEGAGLVTVEVDSADGEPVEARVTAPRALERRAGPGIADAARCIGLAPDDLVAPAGGRIDVASVGFPFPMVEVRRREALRLARPDLATMSQVLPPLGLDGVIVFSREPEAADHAAFGPVCEADLSVRMFAPLIGVLEDPATGAGVAGLAALLADLPSRARMSPEPTRLWRVAQGVDMGRPSAIVARVTQHTGQPSRVTVGGACVAVMQGRLHVAAA